MGWAWLMILWVAGMAGAGAQVQWTTRTSPVNGTLQGVAFGGSTFVAVAATGQIAWSTDNGAQWTSVNPGLSANLTCVAYGNGVFVAMGIPGVALTSSNGKTWTSHTTGVNLTPTQVIYAGGQFLAVGAGGLILTSPNGQTWTQRFPPSSVFGILTGATYGNGQYVAVGVSGTILTSPNGAAWTLQTSGTGSLLYGTAFGGGNFCASGGVNLVLTSKNAQQWSSANTLQPTSAWFEQVIYGSDTFVGVGVNGNVLLSPNGHAWVRQNTGTTNELLGVALGNSVYVAVGSNGTILTSPVAKPTISKQPVNVSAKAGKTVTFKVTAKGTGTLSYRWSRNTTAIKNSSHYSGAGTAELTIKKIKSSDKASYFVTVTDSYGSVASKKVTLTVK